MVLNKTTEGPVKSDEIPAIVVHQVIYLSILAVIGIVANLIVLVKSIQYEKSLKTTSALAKNSTNFLVISLAISDLGTSTFSVAVFILPFYVRNFPTTEFFCKFVQPFRELFLAVSIFCVAFIALGRYLILLKAFRKSNRLFSSRILCSVIIWIICYILFALPFSAVNEVIYLDGAYACDANWESDTQKRSHIISLIVGNVLVPTVMVCLSYLGIIRQLRRAKMLVTPAEIANSNGSRESMAFTVQSVRIVRVSFLLLLAFIVTFLPFTSLLVAFAYNVDLNSTIFNDLDLLHAIALCLLYSSAILNPLIIILSSKTYRPNLRGFKKMLKCCICCCCFCCCKPVNYG